MWISVYALVFISCYLTKVDSDALDFIVIGDWGGIPYPPFSTNIEQGISRSLMEVGNDVKIDFLLGLGDNFYYDGVANEFDSRFQNSFEVVFKADDLFFPWYFIAGNHDWRGNVSAQIAYSNHSKRWNFPDYFYTIERSLPDAPDKKIAIIMIDTALLCGHVSSDFDDEDVFTPSVTQDQSNKYWKFVKDELVRVQGYEYIIVAGHYPIWSVAEHGPTKCLVNQLDPLIKQFNVSAYMNGHDHTIEHIQIPYGNQQAMSYFTIGAANFFSNSEKNRHKIPNGSLKFHWKNVHALGAFALVTVGSEAMEVRILSTIRETLYVSKIPARR